MWGLFVGLLGGLAGGPVGAVMGIAGLGHALGTAVGGAGTKPVRVAGGLVSAISGEGLAGPFLFSRAQWAWFNEVQSLVAEGNATELFRQLQGTPRGLALLEQMREAGWPTLEEGGDPALYVLACAMVQARPVS